MAKEEIILGIIKHIETSPLPNNGSWCIGLTCDLMASYGAWGRPAGLFFWDDVSLEDAKAIESYCVNEKGMYSLSDGPIDSGEPVRICIHPRF
jgi:hypothetical protein